MNPKQPRIARLFHSIVVVGTALSGCGGTASDDEERPQTDDPKGSPDADPTPGVAEPNPTSAIEDRPAPTPAAMPEEPSDCVATQQFQCDDWLSRAGCDCDQNAPLAPTDCELNVQFVCEFTQEAEGVFFGEAVGCRCDTSRPDPSQCEHPEQYRCEANSTVPWYDCFCDEQAPLVREDCESWEIFTCQSGDPVYGCICVAGIR